MGDSSEEEVEIRLMSLIVDYISSRRNENFIWERNFLTAQNQAYN